MKVFTKAVASGIMICLGVTVYLSVSNKIIGALLFSIALFAICSFGMNLFTGKIGYILQTKNNPNCLIIWLGNFVGTVAASALVRIAKPGLAETAKTLMENKLQNNWLSIAILSLFCGILMYLAVENYASNSSSTGKIVGIFLCITVFILSGFEHSIANMGYATFAVSSLSDAGRYLVFIIVVSVFNGIGSILLHNLNLYNKKQ